MSSLPLLRLEPSALLRVPRRRVIVVLLLLAAAVAVALGLLRGLSPAAAPANRAPAGLEEARARAVALARTRNATAPARAATEPAARPTRTADASRAADLFAARSWYVAPPPPPPPPAEPPPAPAAPPLPYTFVGSYTPDGAPTVYVLARGDRVTDVRIGDRLDGVYALEGATPGGLVFDYLPLDIKQILATGAAP